MIKNTPKGRSINEMLMTLAIIAVISVGSYKGFQMLMTKNQVNNLIDDVKLAGFIVVDTMFENMEMSDEEFDYEVDLKGKFTPKASYPYSAFKEKEMTFAVVASQVPYKICEAVKKVKVEWLEEIKPNGKKDVCYEEALNEVSFFFNTNLIEQKAYNHCRSNSDCGLCGTCTNGECTYDEGPLPVRADYVPNHKDACVSCDYSTYGGAIKGIYREECLRCPNRFFEEDNNGGLQGICRFCNSTATIFSYVREEECLRCGNRTWSTYAGKVAPDGMQLGSCGYAHEYTP